MNILLISPKYPDTYWSFKHALKFISKKASNPPLGLLTVASMLPGDWKKKLVDLNVTSLQDDDIRRADYVFIGAMSIQSASVQQIIERCKQHNAKMVAGGPLFTGEPERFTDIDHLVLNEAEITLPLFLEDLRKNTPKKMYRTGRYASDFESKTRRYQWNRRYQHYTKQNCCPVDSWLAANRVRQLAVYN